MAPAAASTSAPAEQLIAPTLQPVDWCYHVLDALRQRRGDDPETGHLEMLLSSFIELRPAPDAFATLLARYAADPRAGIADAAQALQRAWEKALRASLPAALCLSDCLRTLGGLLDDAGARAAYLSVRPDGAVVQGCGPTPYLRALGRLELCQENAGRSALRGQVGAPDPADRQRFETRLRAVGAAVESRPGQSYELVVGPHLIEVESDDGYCHVFRPEEIDALLRQAALDRGPGEVAPAE